MSKKIRELKARKAGLVQQAAALSDVAVTAGRDFTAEEATQFDSLKAQIEGVNRQIEAEEFLAEQQADTFNIKPTSMVSVEDNAEKDDKRGFKHAGEFFRAVGMAGIGKGLDPRLGIGAAAPTTYSNESAGADGGFAIPPEFSREIWRLALGEESLIPRTANVEIAGNSMIFPKDETTPWGGSGVQVYWQSEAAAGQQSKISLGS
ncbi:MAG: phage major capsid protein, partial [Betaproteobacteria bacterium]|nr:phage major capsid protein [Betaproteobacteria bacterium]